MCTPKFLFLSEAVGSEPLARYLPVMIARLMLSLKKASTQEDVWSFGERTMKFADPQRVVATRDEAHLDTFTSESVGGPSRM